MGKKIILSWFLSAVLLLVVAGMVDWGSALSQISKISIPFLFASAVVYSISFVFRAVRWKYIVSPFARISVGESFSIICVSFLANNVLPARLGELLRAYLLSKKRGLGK